MEWGKIKTILICIFTIVNVFLLHVYFKGAYTEKSIDDYVIESTVKIMKQHNISIDKELIPESYDNVKVCNMENQFADINSMLKYVWDKFGTDAIRGFNGESTTIDGNSFVCKITPEVEKIGNMKRHIEKKLQDSGLLQLANYRAVQEDGYICFYMEYENMIFFDSYIKVSYTADGITEIYGTNWLGDRIYEGNIAQSVSPAEILVNFAASYNGKGVEVDGLQSGYYIGRRNETVKSTASPVWEISTSDGGKYYYDMRNGDLLQ